MSERNKQYLREVLNAPAMSFEVGTLGGTLLGIFDLAMPPEEPEAVETYTANLPGRIQPIKIANPDLFKDDEPDGGSPRITLGKESSGTLRVVYHNDGTVTREFTGGAEEMRLVDGTKVSIYPSEKGGELRGYAGFTITQDKAPCPDCAHTEHPGQYWGAQEAETCGTCGGSAVV